MRRCKQIAKRRIKKRAKKQLQILGLFGKVKFDPNFDYKNARKR